MNIASKQLFITTEEKPSAAIVSLIRNQMNKNEIPLFLFEEKPSARIKLGKLKRVRAKGYDQVIIQLPGRTKPFSATLCQWYDSIGDTKDKIRIVDINEGKTYIIAER